MRHGHLYPSNLAWVLLHGLRIAPGAVHVPPQLPWRSMLRSMSIAVDHGAEAGEDSGIARADKADWSEDMSFELSDDLEARLGEVRYALRLAEAKLKAFQWQPIDTAPLNTKVLAFHAGSDGGFQVLAWRREAYGWWCSDGRLCGLTHWMPLPEAPR